METGQEDGQKTLIGWSNTGHDVPCHSIFRRSKEAKKTNKTVTGDRMTPHEMLRHRFWLFLLGCIGSRSIFTGIAFLSATHCYSLRILGAIALLPVLGWFYLVFIGRRDTGFEVFGGRIWWRSLRPVHMLLWGFFVYLALWKCHPLAWVVLVVDTLFGISAFLIHHYQAGHLGMMMGPALFAVE